jgi:hypothetical protein
MARKHSRRGKRVFVRPKRYKAILSIIAVLLCDPVYAQSNDVSALVAALGGDRPYVAADKLVAIGEPAVGALIDALKDKDIRIRPLAVSILAKIPSAVEPLIAALNDRDFRIREAAVQALGASKDPRAVEPLIAVLKRNVLSLKKSEERVTNDPKGLPVGITSKGDLYALFDNSWVSTAFSLREMGSPIAQATLIEVLSGLLDDDYPNVRSNAIRVLAPIAGAGSVHALEDHLVDWYIGKDVARILTRVGWSPITGTQLVHLWIAQRDKGMLLLRWNMTEAVLLGDIASPRQRVLENALYAGIGLGNLQFISDVIAALNSRGSKEMAEAFLNSGQPDLREAAKKWAAARGYSIIAGSGNAPVAWGGM